MSHNEIPLYTEVDGKLVSHFLLSEFANPIGWVILHPKVPWALEMTRAALNARHHPDRIIIRVTDCTRTQNQLERLADKLGWIDEGGKVSRTSYHSDFLGGIAVDFVAYNTTQRCNVSPVEVARIAALYFDWVKWYSDGHVHGDFRSLVNV